MSDMKVSCRQAKNAAKVPGFPMRAGRRRQLLVMRLFPPFSLGQNLRILRGYKNTRFGALWDV